MKFGIHLHGSNRGGVENALANRLHIHTLKRFAIRHHLVEHCADAEQVRPTIDRVAQYLLGGHVMQNRGRFSWHVRDELPGARRAHAQDLDAAIPGAHNLGWFQAVVVDSGGVRLVQTAAHLPADIKQVPDGESLFAGKHGCDAVALHILHGDAELAIHLARAEDRRDVRTR